jgi:fibronectin-binding autotransporter adhesin
VWDGGDSAGNWTWNFNWADNSAPVPSSTLHIAFNGTTHLNNTNNFAANSDFNIIEFFDAAGSFNLYGNAIDLFFQIENFDADVQTVRLDSIRYQGTNLKELNPVNGDLTITSAINNNGVFTEVYGSNQKWLRLEGVMSGSGGITIKANSTVVIKAAMEYTGDTFVDDGGLRLGEGGTTGSLASIVRLAGSKTLTVAENATIKGVSEKASGNAGTVQIGSGKTLTIDGADIGTIYQSSINGSGGNLNLSASGNTILSLYNSQGYSGTTVVSGGKLTTSGAMSTAGVTTSGTGVFEVTTGSGLGSSAYIAVNGGQYIVGAADSIGALSGNSATGKLTLNAQLITTNNSDATFAGILEGSTGSLVKQGAGVLSLSGESTLTGGLFVDQGVLNLSGGSLGAGTIEIGGGTLNNAINTESATLRVSATDLTVGRNIVMQNVTGPSGAAAGARSIDFANPTDTTATIGGTVSLGKTTAVSVASGATGRLSGIVSGAGGLTKTGSGSLTLSGNNTFSGVLTVAEGKLTINTINNASASGALGNSANAVVLGSSSQEGFLHYTGATTSSTKTFTAASGGTAGIEVSNAATTLTLSGAIGGSGAVTKGGAGTLLLAGNNTFSGALSIHDGAIEIASINDNGVAGVLGNNSHAVNLGKTNTSNSSTLLYTGGTTSTTKGLTLVSQTNAAGVVNVSSAAAALTVSGAVTGGGRLEKAGAGTLILSASNNYAGGTTLAAGLLQLNSIHAAGTGKITQTTNNSTLQINTTGTVANAMDLYNIRTMQTVTLSGNKTLHNATYTVDPSTTTTESGTLSGDGGITKQGTGTLVVTGNNSFTGAVAVNEGVLELASTVGGAAAQTVSVSVATNAILLLSQSEQVKDTATVTLSGGTIQRGDGFSETFGALSLAAASTLDYGEGATGTLRFGAYTPTALLTVENFSQGNILRFGNDIGLSLPTGGSLSNSFFSFDNAFSYNSSTFTITAIPEPSTYGAAAGLLAMFLWPVRRRLVKDVKSVLGLRPTGRERIEAYRKA